MDINGDLSGLGGDVRQFFHDQCIGEPPGLADDRFHCVSLFVLNKKERSFHFILMPQNVNIAPGRVNPFG
jgi:hypothetical protein